MVKGKGKKGFGKINSGNQHLKGLRILSVFEYAYVSYFNKTFLNQATNSLPPGDMK
jgi:hypothetical protein